jgi:GWxTD domain-containing protein
MKVSFFTLNVLFVIVLLCMNCSSRVPAVSRQNTAEYYRSGTPQLSAEYVLYNHAPASTRLYFKVSSEQLLYSREANATSYTARVLLTYIVHPVQSIKTIVDSGQVVMTDEGEQGISKLLTGFTDMRIPLPGKYVVETTFRDLNRLTVFYNLLYLDHQSASGSQHFLLTAPGSTVPLFRQSVDSGEIVQLRFYQTGIRKLFIRYHKPIDRPAPPPYAFAEEQLKPVKSDSSWWTKADSLFLLQFNHQGWYSIHVDSSSQNGFSIYQFRTSYPKLDHPIQLLTPLRYLTTKQEYNSMLNVSNLKIEVDKFWLNSAGSEERAREVIREFYTRVEQTNRFFTTNREGWQTDRGMIYLLFGAPTSVYRMPGYETWYYGNDLTTTSALSFNFNYSNTEGVADFILERNTSYKLNWTIAVDSWRQGQVFTAR